MLGPFWTAPRSHRLDRSIFSLSSTDPENAGSQNASPPGEIKSERWVTSSQNRRATSSESALGSRYCLTNICATRSATTRMSEDGCRRCLGNLHAPYRWREVASRHKAIPGLVEVVSKIPRKFSKL